MSTVRDEVGKASKTVDSVLVIFSATVGKQLAGAMPDSKVLVLRSWDDKTAASFSFANSKSSTLLWRSETCDRWCQFPDLVPSDSKPSGAKFVEVRPGLEVVIPHHDVVKQLVGAKLFDALVGLSHDSDDSSAIGAVVTTLHETLGSRQNQQQEQKHDDDPFAAYPDETKIEEVVRAIADKEGYDDQDMLPVFKILQSNLIKSVHNLRALEDEDIKGLGLPRVVFRYLMRVKGQQ